MIVDRSYSTILHNACRQGNLCFVKRLVKAHGGLVDIQDNSGYTPLHKACMNDKLDTARYLVKECNAAVDVSDMVGRTPLHYASMCKQLGIVKCLAESLNVGVDIKDNYGNTPLHYAAMCGRLDVIKFLIESCKADVTVLNQKNQTPLQVLRQRHDVAIAEYLSSRFRQSDSKGAKTINATNTLIQMSHRNINQDRLAALESNLMTDITFLVGRDDQQQTIKACSSILLASVPSIKAMLNESINSKGSNMVSSRTTNERIITLPDFHPTNVRCVLKYIYSGDTSFLDGSEMARLEGLQQLGIVAAHFHCWQFKVIVEAKLIDKHLSQDTLIGLLLFADEHNCMVLKEAAIQMAAKDLNALVDNSKFRELAGCADLMEAIHISRKDTESTRVGSDKYGKMSMVELYGCLNECKGVHLESEMDRPALLELVRKAMAGKTTQAWWIQGMKVGWFGIIVATFVTSTLKMGV